MSDEQPQDWKPQLTPQELADKLRELKTGAGREATVLRVITEGANFALGVVIKGDAEGALSLFMFVQQMIQVFRTPGTDLENFAAKCDKIVWADTYIQIKSTTDVVEGVKKVVAEAQN